MNNTAKVSYCSQKFLLDEISLLTGSLAADISTLLLLLLVVTVGVEASRPASPGSGSGSFSLTNGIKPGGSRNAVPGTPYINNVTITTTNSNDNNNDITFIFINLL
jgi:hypothetical protein